MTQTTRNVVAQVAKRQHAADVSVFWRWSHISGFQLSFGCVNKCSLKKLKSLTQLIKDLRSSCFSCWNWNWTYCSHISGLFIELVMVLCILRQGKGDLLSRRSYSSFDTEQKRNWFHELFISIISLFLRYAVFKTSCQIFSEWHQWFVATKKQKTIIPTDLFETNLLNWIPPSHNLQ